MTNIVLFSTIIIVIFYLSFFCVMNIDIHPKFVFEAIVVTKESIMYSIAISIIFYKLVEINLWSLGEYVHTELQYSKPIF